jgi:multicomponent Na+:H+ antiporter subunit E
MALAWTALQGSPTLANLLGGFVVSAAILWFLRPGRAGAPLIRWRLIPGLRLLCCFVLELVASNLALVREVLSSRPLLHRAILEVPLEPDTDAEIVTLANLVTLTPGTLSLHVSRDRRRLYVHSLLASEAREPTVRASVKRFERLVKEALR